MRLFVALDIPEDVRAAIAALVTKLRAVSSGARWVRVEGLHVTLKFIGEVAAEKAEQIKAALAAVTFSAPIKMALHDLGYFPSARRPRVLWIGIKAGPELGVLAAEVERALEPLGVARDSRPYSPHLTLARFDSPQGLTELNAAIAKAGALDFGGMIASELHLYQSVLKRGGAEYTRLATYRFQEGESQ